MNSRLRNRLNPKVRPFVSPGETVQAAFCASTRPMWLWMVALGGGLLAANILDLFTDSPRIGFPAAVLAFGSVVTIYMFITPQRIVAVTDQRILVLACRPLTSMTPTRVLRELPRSTRLSSTYPIAGLGEPLWVHWRFKAEVRAADAALHV